MKWDKEWVYQSRMSRPWNTTSHPRMLKLQCRSELDDQLSKSWSVLPCIMGASSRVAVVDAADDARLEAENTELLGARLVVMELVCAGMLLEVEDILSMIDSLLVNDAVCAGTLLKSCLLKVSGI